MLEQDEAAHVQRGAQLHKLRKTLLRKKRHVLNKKPPQGWPQALKKRWQKYVEWKRSSMSPHRIRLLKSPKMMTTQRRR
jgi:hypothetical protein